MALILTRSSYNIIKGNLDANAGLNVEISRNVDGQTTILSSYNMGLRGKNSIDISALIASEFTGDDDVLHVRTTLSGSIDGVAQPDQVNDFIATNGYVYSTETYNKDFSTDLRANAYYTGSSDTIYKLSESSLNIPLLNASLTQVVSNSVINGNFDTDSDWVKETADWTISNGASFLNSTDLAIDRLYQDISGLNGNEVRVRFEVKDYSGTGTASMRYPFPISITGNGVYEAKATAELDRVQFQAEADDLATPLTFSIDSVFVGVVDSNSYEEITVEAKNNGSVVGTKTVVFNSDTDSAYNNVVFNIDYIDEVLITTDYATKTLRVNTTQECKFPPYILTFKNKLGVDEDLWFFKKSTRKINVESSEFTANQLSNRLAGGFTSYKQVYNKNGNESLTLNSGFVDESLNESFKQLLLSEEVKLYDFDNNTSEAVKIADSSLQFKTSANDKLINYTIEVEMLNNIIDNIN